MKFHEGENEEGEILVEERSSLQIAVLLLRFNPVERVLSLQLSGFHNLAEGQVLRDPLGYDPKRKNASYKEGTILSIARLAAWLATLVRYFVDN